MHQYRHNVFAQDDALSPLSPLSQDWSLMSAPARNEVIALAAAAASAAVFQANFPGSSHDTKDDGGAKDFLSFSTPLQRIDKDPSSRKGKDLGSRKGKDLGSRNTTATKDIFMDPNQVPVSAPPRKKPVSEIHRTVDIPPADLLRSALFLTPDTSLPADKRDDILNNAEEKRNQVRAGTVTFGRKLVIESFQMPGNKNQYNVRQTFPAILSLLALVGEQLIHSADGIVAVWPATVFTSDADKDSGKSGEPVLVFHGSLFRVLMVRLFSCCKWYMTTSCLSDNFENCMASYNMNDDHNLVSLTGLDPFRSPSKKMFGFMMMPAHVYDVIQHYIPPGEICQVLTNAFPKYTTQFTEENKPLWMGDQRASTVSLLLKNADQAHNKSMAWARPLDGKIRNPVTNKVWKLKPLKVHAHYDDLSFCMGLSTPANNVSMLNDMYEFFTNQTLPKDMETGERIPVHMLGFTKLNTNAPVLSLAAAIEKQLLMVAEKTTSTTNALRSERFKLGKRKKEQAG
jgi:hypothetical protein